MGDRSPRINRSSFEDCSVKNITIVGNVGKDAVNRETNGNSVTSFSVAVQDGFGDKKRTLWFDCSIWGSRGEKLAQHITKGTRVWVSGDLGTREHEGKTYLTVRVNDVTLMGSGTGKVETGTQSSSANKSFASADLDDEIPF